MWKDKKKSDVFRSKEFSENDELSEVSMNSTEQIQDKILKVKMVEPVFHIFRVILHCRIFTSFTSAQCKRLHWSPIDTLGDNAASLCIIVFYLLHWYCRQLFLLCGELFHSRWICFSSKCLHFWLFI